MDRTKDMDRARLSQTQLHLIKHLSANPSLAVSVSRVPGQDLAWADKYIKVVRPSTVQALLGKGMLVRSKSNIGCNEYVASEIAYKRFRSNTA